ncbi:ribosomal protein L7/L12 C-terminal domain-containing protein [Gaertneriomyces semiglobifer]|nr:ribosomal protein L7/L12 C-terminal domain-containing protein [Gaertneriomyces semiglobifer]
MTFVARCTMQAVRRCPRAVPRRAFISTPRPLQAAATETPVDPKIATIVDQIAGLNLLETASLVGALKTRLNIQDIAMPVAAAAVPAAAGAAAAPAVEEKPAEKTEFKVKLEKFDAGAKAKIIKEIKAMIPGANLVEAKKFVESVPKVIRENVSKEDAEKMKKTLEALGATVVLE